MNGLRLPLNPWAVLPEPWCHANLICKAGQVKWWSRKAFFVQIHTVFHGVLECSLSTSLPCSQGALVLCGRINPSSCNSQGWIPSLFISVARRFCGSHCICLRSWKCRNTAWWACDYLQALLSEKRLLMTALWGVCLHSGGGDFSS